MSYNFEEQDQLDDLKAFWNKYGTFILTVVTVVALSVAAYRLWGWYQNKQAVDAAGAYSTLQQAVREKDMARVRGASKTLFEDHDGSMLAAMGGLVAAKAHFDAGELDDAAQALRWVAENSEPDTFGTIAHIRLAGILLDQDKAEEGLALLDGHETPEAYKGQVADRRGDLLAALGKRDEAIAAYDEALSEAGFSRGPQAGIRLKRDALKAAG
ncbi:MAG: YfgM family protein [Burkholderiaceae bacterium]